MCGPQGVLRISWTALTACLTSGNCAIATFVGTRGARRSVAAPRLNKRYSSSVEDFTLSYNAQGTLCADEKLGSVKSSGRLASPLTRLDNFAGRKHNRLVIVTRVTRRRTTLELTLTTFRNHSAFAVPYLTAFAIGNWHLITKS